MIKSNYQKIKAEIFKLSTLGKMKPLSNEAKTTRIKQSRLKNDELGYFTALDNL